MRDHIPQFFVYGEPSRELELGFLHVETVMARRNLHHGHVAPHRHDAMAQITFWTKGSGDYVLDDAVLPFRAPAISFVPSGVVHGFSVDAQRSDAIVASVADNALPALSAIASLSLSRPVMIRQGDPDEWRRLRALMEMALETYGEPANGSQGETLALIGAVLAQMARLAARAPGTVASTQALLATRFRELAETRFRQNWTVAQYVEALGTTPYLLSKACRSTFAAQPKDMLGERRFLEAKRLLLFTIRSMEEIAAELGMKDGAYFSRSFRRRAGVPPAAWRERELARRQGVREATGRVDARDATVPATHQTAGPS